MDGQAIAYTYEQAATALGIQAEAVRARLRRGALRRGPRANDGRPTVLLSPGDIATLRASVRTERPESGPDSGSDSAGRPDGRDISALAELLRVLTERAEREATVLRAEAARERERADKADVVAGSALADLAIERTKTAVAEAKLEAAEAALAEARRPFWRRWLGD